MDGEERVIIKERYDENKGANSIADVEGRLLWATEGLVKAGIFIAFMESDRGFSAAKVYKYAFTVKSRGIMWM